MARKGIVSTFSTHLFQVYLSACLQKNDRLTLNLCLLLGDLFTTKSLNIC